MNYNEIENEDVKKVVEDMVELLGISYSATHNESHFGTLDFRMVLEILKIVELKKMNETLDKIDTRLFYMLEGK